ncbi:MAG: histidine ammonia-lyase [Rhizobiales bacterium]|nr:histidine ammonia-lyase [Hyphomicrobiales bacterium]
MTGPIELTGHDLNPESLAAVAEGGAPVTIADTARRAMRTGRAVVDKYIAEGIPAYGLNTGLGARAAETLPADEIAAFSAHLVRGRAQGIGAPLLPAEVRAVMLARLNTLLTGAAGASPHIADHLAEALNRNIIAVMPRTASIGAGDLTAMAALPFALIGEGEILIDGAPVPAAEALKAHGLEPLELGPKDGLVLCNITAFSVGLAGLAANAARRALTGLQIAAALSFEGFRGNTSPLEDAVAGTRPQAGQVVAAAQLRHLLQGGLLLDQGAARRLQDPLSFRCVAQVNGSAGAQLGALEDAVTIELNHSADNPLVLVGENRITSSGNFHLPHLSLQIDGTARALAWSANDAVSRIQRMMNAALSGLPPLLSSHATGRAGFGPLLKPLEALRAEIIHLSAPVPVMASHNADGIEDSLTFAPLAAQKLSQLTAKLNLIAAFELIAAAQAVDLAQPQKVAPRLAKVHRAVRGICPFIEEDRPLGRQIEAVAEELVASGRLAQITGLTDG